MTNTVGDYLSLFAEQIEGPPFFVIRDYLGQRMAQQGYPEHLIATVVKVTFRNFTETSEDIIEFEFPERNAFFGKSFIAAWTSDNKQSDNTRASLQVDRDTGVTEVYTPMEASEEEKLARFMPENLEHFRSMGVYTEAEHEE